MSVTGQHTDLGPLVERGRASFAARARWNVLEVAFWLAALATVFLLPSKHLILTEIAILALFAISLDLILGYAGIVSLGHAAFFGFGAYVAGILAKYGIIKEPVLALLASGRRGGGARFCDELPGAARLGPHPPDGHARRGAGAARNREPA